ncbi:uncharacterized protein TM35_000151830, partial [Trypanosoma theileri]
MTKAVMVRCYLLCLLTLSLCCASGLVWADSPKASESSNCVTFVGVPPFIVKTVPCDEARNAPTAAEPTQPAPGKPGPDSRGDPSGREVNQVTTNSHQEQEVSRGDKEELTVDSENKGRSGSQAGQQTLEADGTPSGTRGHNNHVSSPESAKGRDIQVTEE